MRVAGLLQQFAERLAKFHDEALRRAQHSRNRAVELARALKRSALRFAESARDASRRARSAVEASAAAQWMAKRHGQLSRLAQKSPEGTGAVGGLLMSVVLTLAAMGVGAYRVGLAEAAAEDAKSIASQEHPSQVAAAPAPPPVAEPEPAPPEPEAAVAPAPKLPQMGEAFIERFEGDRLDEERWYISDGWSNGDWMENDWRRSQVSVTPEGLRLTLERAPAGSAKPLTGAEVQTRQKFRYGYFEVRMRVPHGQGLITGAFSFIPHSDGLLSNEIDIEILGRATRRVELTIHENRRATSKKITLPFDSADGFHTYGIDWQPDYVRWYANGVMIHEERGRAVRQLTRPQLFLLHLWGTKKLAAWANEVDFTKQPWMLDVACVAYTPTYGGRALCD